MFSPKLITKSHYRRQKFRFLRKACIQTSLNDPRCKMHFGKCSDIYPLERDKERYFFRLYLVLCRIRSRIECPVLYCTVAASSEGRHTNRKQTMCELFVLFLTQRCSPRRRIAHRRFKDLPHSHVTNFIRTSLKICSALLLLRYTVPNDEVLLTLGIIFNCSRIPSMGLRYHPTARRVFRIQWSPVPRGSQHTSTVHRTLPCERHIYCEGMRGVERRR